MRSLPLAHAAWEFRDATKRSAWRPAVVPGCVHRDLLRLGLIPDPFWGTNELDLQWIEERDWEYRARFTVSAEFLRADENIDLVADGLDTVATVLLNGREIARTENMFVGHRWPVKKLLRAGANELVVRFGSAMQYIRTHRRNHQPREFNDPVGRSQVIRKQQCQFGWDWGPRLVTAGIWRDLRLEAWSGNQLESVRVTQHHAPDGSVTLEFAPEFARREANAEVRGTIYLNYIAVAQIKNRESKIQNPQLWWPNGHGAQTLYTLQVEAVRPDGSVIGTWSRRIGLRTVALDRHRDDGSSVASPHQQSRNTGGASVPASRSAKIDSSSAGETFQFVVNGRPVFAKGANWIPAHSFVAALDREDYARDLRSAAAANMNMLRVWGGGIYESEHFYDLCDELGLLVWQDFMFACAIYPGDAAFVRSVRDEARHQVRRLRHRACLALWCGNNEVAQLNTQGNAVADLLKNPRLRRDYETIFHRVLPEAVAALDGVTAYWPSSQWRGSFADSAAVPEAMAAGEKRGDTHYWDVWHARHPVKAYERWRFRFVSEFGMQSYSSPETNATFCPPHADNIFGHEMENHQKNRHGNQVILDYVSQHYRFPKDQDSLIYLSQLNQAWCMQVGVEHYRRLMPHCMGALYWQLNDCWPAASWSSLEFTGRWRALHHVARRFFAPALVTAHVPGDESDIIGNYRRSDVREVRLYTVYDAPAPARGVLRWDLLHLDGRVLLSGRQPVALRYGESVLQKTLDLAVPLAKHGRDSLVLRLALDVGGRCVSEDSVFLTSHRFLRLPEDTRTKGTIRLRDSRHATLTFRSRVFQHRFAFELPGLPHRASDNYFELYPNEPRTILVELARPVTLTRLQRTLRWRSLADSY